LSDDLDEGDLAENEHRLEPEIIRSGLKDAGIGKEECVFVFDVLPRFDRESLSDILRALASLPCTFFFVIPLTYSNRLLADGSNANKTVEAKEWWAELLGNIFGEIEAVKTHSEYDVAFATRRLSEGDRRAIGRLSLGVVLGRQLDRIGSRAVILARTLARSIESKTTQLGAVEGKSVSVVGNARSLGRSSLGAKIDANDIVVRFNRAPIISREANGYRTDWIATSMPLEPEFIEALNPQRILWMSRRRKKMSMGIATASRLYLHPKEDVLRLAAQTSVERPSTGLMMIDLLARSRCRSVELYGFDFYKSQSLSGHQSIDTTPHAYDREEAYVMDLIATDSRFKICR
jgi:hypothetical protein